jgi:hypothetical protein
MGRSRAVFVRATSKWAYGHSERHAVLVAALELAQPDRVGNAVVVPLLNGIDHVALSRERYEQVLAATIAVESERVESGVVRQPTPFATSSGRPRGRTRLRMNSVLPASASRLGCLGPRRRRRARAARSPSGNTHRSPVS